MRASALAKRRLSGYNPAMTVNSPVAIAPSILAADFARLGEEVRAASAGGADYIHVDVMDGHFVPNLTVGPEVVRALKRHSQVPLDVHLMLSRPQDFITPFAEAGADIITIHLEADPHVHRHLQAIRAHGVRAGLSLVPSTPAGHLACLLDSLDLILVMSVNPGFGGQSFLPSQLTKIAELRRMIDAAGAEILLEVDGGITAANAPEVVAAGARVLVAGSAVFRGDPGAYGQRIAALRGAPQ